MKEFQVDEKGELKLSDIVSKVTNFIEKQKGNFIKLNEHCINNLDFSQECEFARQLLMKNSYTLDAARMNPDSLHTAISNVASIGITLNPALQFSYLVPRKINGEINICLDISYRGLTKLATDTGIVKAIKAELVYKNDTFDYFGFHEKPVFKAEPFSDRGPIIGVYAMAVLTDGGYLVETMRIDEVNRIRDDTESYKAAIKKGDWTLKNNVWVKYYGEMVKKTVIKRTSKTLPTSNGTKFLGKAIDVINEHEGIELNAPEKLTVEIFTDEEMVEYKRCIEDDDFYNLYPLTLTLCIEGQVKLNNLCVPEAKKGNKIKERKIFEDKLKNSKKELESSLYLIKEYLTEEPCNDDAIKEILDECSIWTKEFLMKNLSIEQQSNINYLKRDNT